MDYDNQQSSMFPNTPVRSFRWGRNEFLVFFVNLFLLLLLGVAGSKFIVAMVFAENLADAVFAGIITGIIFCYSLIFAKSSMEGLGKKPKGTNISNIIRYFSWVYFLGVCLLYIIVIIKLGEKDYEFDRFLEYMLLLLGSFIGVNIFARIPPHQDIWLLSVMVLGTSFIHVGSLIWQYLLVGNHHELPQTAQYQYFFQDLTVLVEMIALSILNLLGSWKV